MWIAIATPPFTDIETFDAVTEAVGGVPEGLQARYAGRAEDGLRVVTVWDSKEHADRFFADRLGPALAKTLGPEPGGTPSVTGVEVLRSFVPQQVS